jgi:hypothetical protein
MMLNPCHGWGIGTRPNPVVVFIFMLDVWLVSGLSLLPNHWSDQGIKLVAEPLGDEWRGLSLF